MRSLYPYQRRALVKATSNPEGGALLMEPGLGKTLVSIRAAQMMGALRVVVVGPLVSIGVWRDELETEGEIVYTPEGSRAEKAQFIREQEAGWIVLNYEATIDKAVERAIDKFNPDLVIFDEAHKIKTPTAKRSRAAHRISKGRRTLILTGTPITKNLLDLYSLYKAISPEIWDGMTWTKFKQKYAIFGGYLNKEVIGVRDQTDLRERIKPFSWVVRKEDVLDLPPRRDQLVPVYLTGKNWEEYRYLAQHGVLESREWVTDNPLTKALRMSQLVGEIKLPYTLERIEELVDAGEKVVVFYRFIAEGEELSSKIFKRTDADFYNIRGATPSKVRENFVRAFQEKPGPAVLFGQIQAASTAVTLTASSEVIYHSQTFSYEDAVQSRDRVYRISQNRPVRYQYMTAVGPQGGKTIDGLVLDALQTKSDFASAVMADPTILEVPDA